MALGREWDSLLEVRLHHVGWQISSKTSNGLFVCNKNWFQTRPIDATLPLVTSCAPRVGLFCIGVSLCLNGIVRFVLRLWLNFWAQLLFLYEPGPTFEFIVWMCLTHRLWLLSHLSEAELLISDWKSNLSVQRLSSLPCFLVQAIL